jgi:hypothetical protein
MTTSVSAHDSVVVMCVQCSFGHGSTTASFDPSPSESSELLSRVDALVQTSVIVATTLLDVRAVGNRVGHGALDGEMFQCVVLCMQRGQQDCP